MDVIFLIKPKKYTPRLGEHVGDKISVEVENASLHALYMINSYC
jgi:hypothetical protein